MDYQTQRYYEKKINSLNQHIMILYLIIVGIFVALGFMASRISDCEMFTLRHGDDIQELQTLVEDKSNEITGIDSRVAEIEDILHIR